MIGVRQFCTILTNAAGLRLRCFSVALEGDRITFARK